MQLSVKTTRLIIVGGKAFGAICALWISYNFDFVNRQYGNESREYLADISQLHLVDENWHVTLDEFVTWKTSLHFKIYSFYS